MKIFVVAVRDRAADVFGQPAFVQSLGLAIRSFGDQVNDHSGNSPFAKHPDDYDLYHIGFYEDSEGILESVKPKMVAIGKELAIKAS